MSDSANALARSMQNFGSALGNLGETIITLDAKAKSEAAQTAIIQKMEEFKRSLLTDSEYGTPEVVSGKREGYIAKYDALLKDLRKQAEGIDNEIARQQVHGFLEETAARQESAVTQLQYNAWSKDTFASTMRSIRTFNDTTTLSPEERIEHTYDVLNDLLRTNVIDKEKAIEVIGGETSYIMRQVLVAGAKEAYETGGYEAAILAITDSKTSVNTALGAFGASDAIKAQAKQEIAEYDRIVQERENSRMTSAYANSVATYLGRGDKDTPVLSIDLIESSPYLSAQAREHWINQIRSLDNWMNTGSGAKELGNAKALYGTMAQIAYRIRDTMGTSRAGSVAQITMPDGKERTFTLDPNGWKAIMQEISPMIIQSNDYERFLKLEDVFKPREGKSLSVFSALDDALLAKSKEKGFPPNLYIEMQASIEAWKNDHPTATPEQVEKARQLLINDKIVQINTAHAWDYISTGAQGEEKIGEMIASGEMGYYMADKGGGVFGVQSPLIKDSYSQYTTALYREIRKLPTGEDNLNIPENAVGRSTANGEYWISTADPQLMRSLGLGGSSRSAGALSVSYTARLYGPGRTMQRFRQIEYPQKEFKFQVYLEKLGWTDVIQYTGEDGIKYWYVTPEKIQEFRVREKEAERQIQQETQERIWESWPQGL